MCFVKQQRKAWEKATIMIVQLHKNVAKYRKYLQREPRSLRVVWLTVRGGILLRMA